MNVTMKRRRIVAILQARMGSSRFPGKVLMPLPGGESILGTIIRRVSNARTIDKLVVATSTNSNNDPIEKLCGNSSIDCHRGSEEDVLGRYVSIIKNYSADIIVRLTADNPFVDGKLVDLVVNGFLNSPQPIAYANNIDSGEFPIGLYVEVVDAKALKTSSLNWSPENREHVTWYIRNNRNIFAARTIGAPGKFLSESLTVDTKDDYIRVSKIFKKLLDITPNFTFEDLMVSRQIIHQGDFYEN